MVTRHLGTLPSLELVRETGGTMARVVYTVCVYSLVYEHLPEPCSKLRSWRFNLVLRLLYGSLATLLLNLCLHYLTSLVHPVVCRYWGPWAVDMETSEPPEVEVRGEKRSYAKISEEFEERIYSTSLGLYRAPFYPLFRRAARPM